MKADDFLRDAERFLKSARILVEIEDFISSTNRSYYAVFNAARAALMLSGHDTVGAAKTHSGLISAFGLHLVKTGILDAELGRNFSRLAKERQNADYDGATISRSDTLEDLKTAGDFVAAVRALELSLQHQLGSQQDSQPTPSTSETAIERIMTVLTASKPGNIEPSPELSKPSGKTTDSRPTERPKLR